MSDIKTVDLWFNAFIPAACPPWSDQIADGPGAGLSIIYGIGTVTGPFLTDQRGFAAEMEASACLHSHVRFAVAPTTRILDQWHSARPLAIVDAANAAVAPMVDVAGSSFDLHTPQTIGRSAAAAKLVRLLPRVNPAPPGPETLYVHVECWHTPADAAFAELIGPIGAAGIVVLNSAKRSAEFHGQIGRFPAYEMYLSVDGGPPVALFRQSPPRHAGAFDAPGPMPRPIRGAVNF